MNLWLLRGLDTLGRFSAVFDKGDNFCDFLFTILRTKVFWKKGSTVKAPSEKRAALKGKTSTPFRVESFSGGRQKQFGLSCLPMYLFILNSDFCIS